MKIFLLCLATLSIHASAHASADLQTRLIAEVRVVAEPGDLRATGNAAPSSARTKQYVFKPAAAVAQGQEIFYTVRVRNSGSETIAEPQIVQRIPANTRYVAGSATAAGSKVEFSIDGGREFHEASSLPAPVNSPAGHPVANYTHIRWTLGSPLAPGAVLLARFRAEFQ